MPPRRRAFVTGGTAGIGRATAEALIADGRDVVISGTREETEGIAREIGAAGSVRVDLSEPGAAARAADEALGILGSVDILISNSGGPPPARFLDTPPRWRSIRRLKERP